MATSLTGIGSISYNGFTFNGPRVRSEISVEPQYDQTGRTIIGYKGTLSVEAIVTSDTAGQGGGTSDAYLVVTDIRARLSEPGGQLVYNGLGHGDLEINTSATNRDIDFGPKPRLIRFHPIPGNTTFEVLWVCEFMLKECSAGSFAGSLGAVRSYSYGVDYTIDYSGLTIRTVAGHIAMSLNRTSAGSQSIPDTADSLVSILGITVPLGFRRESTNRRLSEDKSRLDFAVIDREMPSVNSYPENVVDMEMSHSVSSNTYGMQIENDISGYIEVTRNGSLSDAFNRVILLVYERVQIAKQNTGNAVIPIDFAFTESMFGRRRIDFSFRYMTTHSGFSRAIQDTGMFVPVQSTNFQVWSNSLQQAAWTARGLAGLSHSSSSDAILNACSSGNPPQIVDLPNLPVVSEYSPTLGFTCPDQSKSYVVFENSIDIISRGEVVNHLPSPTSTSRLTNDKYVSGDGAVILPAFPSEHKNYMQDISEGKFLEVWIRGYSVRVCYYPEVPRLVTDISTSAGSELREYSTDMSNTKLGDIAGNPVRASKWLIKYKTSLTSVPALVSLFSNMEDRLIITDQDPQGFKKRSAM